MGLRYRKSINLGGGFRINLSKSGIGYSWGVKGARITKTSRGTVRGSVGIPGTGIYYSEEISTKKKAKTASSAQNASYNPIPVPHRTVALPSESLETINIADYKTAEYQDLLQMIEKIQNLNLLSTILIWTFLFFTIIPASVISGIVGIILKLYVHIKLPISIEYQFDEEAKQTFDNLTSTWMSMNQNNKVWQTISATQIQNKKAHGGANRGITRIPVKAINKAPFFIKTNVNIFGLQLRKQQLLFLPDKLLIVSGRKVGAISYNEVRIGLSKTRFIEDEIVPTDAKVIDKTWLKVNKNGTPDKRYKDNRQVPICEYGTVVIESGSILHVEFMCSNSSTIEQMSKYAKQVFKK